eukprot:gene31699-38310_t
MENNQFFVSGKRYFRLNGMVLTASGVAVIIASALVIHNSGGNYIGGIYAGITSVLFGLSLLRIEEYTSYWSLFFGVFANFILCIVAVGITSANQYFVNSLEACGSYGNSIDNSCGVNSYVDCVGNEDYYPQAYGCELAYANDFLDLVPEQMGAALAFLVFAMLASLAVGILLTISQKQPTMLRSPEETQEAQERGLSQSAAPPAAAANVIPAGVPVVVVATPMHSNVDRNKV